MTIYQSISPLECEVRDDETSNNKTIEAKEEVVKAA